MNKTEILNFKDKLLFELDYVIYIFDDMINTLKYITECKYKNDVNNIRPIIQEFKKCFNDYDYKIFVFICIFIYKLDDYTYKSLFKNIDIYKYFLYNISKSEYDKLEDLILYSFIKYIAGHTYLNYFTFSYKLKQDLQEYLHFIYSLNPIKHKKSYKSNENNYIYKPPSNQDFLMDYIKR